uniref:Uncharacterized protein n=1 Tax=Rhizophora mucronata TaxID=61149 RepID=A0A2P2PLC3_RHIMU
MEEAWRDRRWTEQTQKSYLFFSAKTMGKNADFLHQNALADLCHVGLQIAQHPQLGTAAFFTLPVSASASANSFRPSPLQFLESIKTKQEPENQDYLGTY